MKTEKTALNLSFVIHNSEIIAIKIWCYLTKSGQKAHLSVTRQIVSYCLPSYIRFSGRSEYSVLATSISMGLWSKIMLIPVKTY